MMEPTTKAERYRYQAIIEPLRPEYRTTSERISLRLIADIDRLREALAQIVINTEDECDRVIAQAALEEK